MKNYTRGFAAPLLIAIVGLLIIGGGTYVYTKKASEGPQKEAVSDAQDTEAGQNISQDRSTAGWKSYTDTKYGFEVKYPSGWQVMPPMGTAPVIAFGQINSIGLPSYDGEWFIFVYADSETNVDDMRRETGEEETEPISIGGVPALRLANGNYESILIRKNGKNYWVHNGNRKNDLFPSFYNSLRFTSSGAMPAAGALPDVIKDITIDPETGDRKPENDPMVVAQVRKDVQNGMLLWFQDPIEVSRRYAARFGIAGDSQFSLEQAARSGGDSGLMHSIVLAADSTKIYRIYLISEPSKPYIWEINTVTDIQQSNRFRVESFTSATIFGADGIGHQEIVQRFGDGTTLFYLNVKNPIVTFYLNQPADPSSVNPGSIIVRANGATLSGARAKAATEQGSSHGATFPMHSIQVDLSGVANLKNYAGQNIQIILTDKIKDVSGAPLQQCDRSYNKGECIADASGQRIKVFGAELKAYSL